MELGGESSWAYDVHDADSSVCALTRASCVATFVDFGKTRNILVLFNFKSLYLPTSSHRESINRSNVAESFPSLRVAADSLHPCGFTANLP
jgi:hypothetical protein